MDQVCIHVDKNTSLRLVEDYIDSVILWCGANCNGQYTVNVIETEVFKIKANIVINFDDANDAIYFKLSPVWTKELNNNFNRR
ncbi:MAG: hypothetical protein HC836_33155 [Richelia sp. RM2_1_2]|nr:hypothetical protein [Richelia sp. RM2_1_2]